MTGLYEVWWNCAELALAVALDDSVEFFLTDVHDCKLNADKKVCISRSYQMSCTKCKKISTALSLARFDSIFFFFILWCFRDMISFSLTSALGLAASCVMSNISACFSETGWPWTARLTGKGYFQDSGKSHTCSQNVIKDSQSNTCENVPFLRGEEENKRDEQIITLLLNYQQLKEECEEDSCPTFLIRVLPVSRHLHDNYSNLGRQRHHHFCMHSSTELKSWCVTGLVIDQAWTLK